MTAPITPDEVGPRKRDEIPAMVFSVFNDLIVENMDSTGRAKITLDLVLSRLATAGVDTSEAFSKHWLDVEPFYREAGWEVSYDKPGYNEAYAASYEFRKPRRLA